jgi:hypothetical protein
MGQEFLASERDPTICLLSARIAFPDALTEEALRLDGDIINTYNSY